MRVVVALAPFLLFLAIQRLVGIETGLLAAAVAACLLLVVDLVLLKKSLKILEIGTAVLFASLATYVNVSDAHWSVARVRLAVDTGLFLIIVISLLIRQPFTLQYARESVPQERWDRPEFIKLNYVVTAVWACAFAVTVAVDAAWATIPRFPPLIVIVVSVLAAMGAVRFPSWYSARQQAKTSGPSQEPDARMQQKVKRMEQRLRERSRS